MTSADDHDQAAVEQPPNAPDEDWIDEQLAKAPRHLNREQAQIARQLRARTAPAKNRDTA